MKNILNSVMRCAGNLCASLGSIHRATKVLTIAFGVILLLGSCQKQADIVNGSDQNPTVNSHGTVTGDAVLTYTGLSSQTIWELQQVRAATAKYRNIDNAIRDGYVDIAVDVQHMGHHFMKTSIVDATFDLRQPEILVYNKNDKGRQELVAVEYAVPLTDPMPEGFTGSNDEWNSTSGFPFWLVHAWVWAYNPAGVFNWTNPSIELH